MREIFAPRHEADPGPCFYTILAADLGKTFIRTEIGLISLGGFLGYVTSCDIGKRLYRVLDAADNWYWQAENDEQFAHRRIKERGHGARVA